MRGYTLLTALPFPIARIVAGALESEGVRVRIEREALSSIYGLDTGRFATRILVVEEDLERARRLLDEIEATEA